MKYLFHIPRLEVVIDKFEIAGVSGNNPITF